ncbi:MAG: outer membrane protein assembly factor BamE [Burkholderiaceae bacterium]|nr:outer membrane protein assembly factor BamE [Burkholderiaceae bacterium]
MQISIFTRPVRSNLARSQRALWVSLFCLVLGGCSSAIDNTQRAWMNSIFQPYVPDIVQGNFISSEQYSNLKVGMTREQVRQIMGTPLLASYFHANRWDYVFEFKREGETVGKERRVTLIFEGDQLAKFGGDALPTEVELVAEIDTYARERRSFWDVMTGKNKPPKRQKKVAPEVMVISQPNNLPLPSPQPNTVITPVKN